MARIIQTTNTADNATYSGIRDIVGITATNDVIDANPLFLSAEDYIIALLPDAELQNPDVGQTGRNYPNRVQVLRALVYIAGYFMLQGGGTTANTRSSETAGEVKSRTIDFGPVSQREEYNVSSSSGQSSESEDRSDFFKAQGDAILERLGASITETSDEELLVLSTDSLLAEDY